MRRKHFFAVLALAGLSVIFAPRPAHGQVSIGISFFHDELAPQGRWIVAADYGDAWIPSGVPGGWTPYVDGEWVYTDYGWTWVSEDSWGPIAYHYGTWAFVPPYGWVWVPGTVWAPAWVTWAYTDDYIGWAPVPVGFGMTVSGYTGTPVVVSQTSYVFVPANQFSGVPITSVRVSQDRNSTILARAQKTTQFSVSAGIVHNTGLPVAHVERVSGKKVVPARADSRIRPTALSAAGSPGQQSGRISVVAPATERAQAIKSGAGKQGPTRETDERKALESSEPGRRRQEVAPSEKPGVPEQRTVRTPEQPERRGQPERMERSPNASSAEKEKRDQQGRKPEPTPKKPQPTPKPEER